MKTNFWNIVLTIFGLATPSFHQLMPLTGRISTDHFRLIGGQDLNEGRLQIAHANDGSWSTVCTDVNAINDAIGFALCARLGYQVACKYGTGAEFSSPDVDLGSVEEVSFGNCDIGSTYTEQDCDITGIPSVNGACSSNTQDLWLHCTSGPGELELRLANPLSSFTGTVQARCRGSQDWASVCYSYSWDRRDAEVACRHLGFSFAAERAVISLANLEPTSIPSRVVISEFGCAGNETDLLECRLGLTRTSCTSVPRLSCGIETSEYGSQVGLCGNRHLCGVECSQQRDTTSVPRRGCHCDDVCLIFGDCCYDYEENCNSESREPPTSLNGLPINWFGCVEVPGFDTTFMGYFLVEICPEDWLGSGIREMCESPANDSDVFRSIPVYNNITFIQYKNIYCAVCHGERHDQVVPWSVEARYSSDRGGLPFLPNFDVGPPAFGTYTGKFVVRAPDRSGIEIRQCSTPAIDTCLEEYRGSLTEQGCKTYSASMAYRPSAFSGTITNYRNAYCGKCNNLTLSQGDSCDYDYCEELCGDDPWGRCFRRCAAPEGFLTIDVLFSFSSQGSSIAGVDSCMTGELYDPFLGSCRLLSCSSGYEIIGDECVKVVAPPTVEPDQPKPGTVTAFAYNSNNTVNVDLADCLRALLGPKTQGIVYWDANLDSASGNVAVNFLTENETTLYDVSEALNLLVHSSWCNATRVAFFLEFEYILPLDHCLNFVEVGTDLFQAHFGQDIRTKVVRLSQFNYNTSTSVYNFLKTDSACLDNSLTCPILTLNSSDIEKSEIGNETVVKYIPSGLVLPLGMYVVLADGSAAACADAVIQPSTPGPPTTTELAYRYLYLVLTILSLVALAATFFVYSLLPTLRNLAGRCIMNLVVALFLANLLLLLNGFFVEVPTLCLVAAPVIHFTWLAAFMWMLALSINVARTITSKVVNKSEESETRPLLLYMLFSWGTSLVIVGICIGLHFCQCVVTGSIYASEISCYIVNPQVNLYAFGIPVAVTLTVGICLFLFTVVNLRISRSATRVARNETRMQEAKVEFVIYTRLSVLMGMSWVFGFLTQVIQGYAMLFVFVILNSLQGFLIFLSFCFTARVRKLLREKYGRRHRSDGRRRTRRKPTDLVDASGTHSQINSHQSHSANTDTTLV
ncbi:uncharacterized protein LOC110978216 [Acanthaster planci]|uniref:Uncharacterized protein LOC110978216 n=1 Tax=Acanthaster planci TaxID=133434 RepID=A0A8B7Y687_ACAPL|nr:uncharacterized protein LOC110978216 [Acanthaster planci]